MKRELTQTRLKELLRYNKRTGVFTWRIDRTRIKAGTIAGKVNRSGHRHIRVDGRDYQAHRLAFVYVTGRWPENIVDHRNRCKDDNRWMNLRPAVRSQNAQNSKRRSDNTTGFKGVSLAPRGKVLKFQARIMLNAKAIYLGAFATPEEAHGAYITAAQKYFGEFARAA